MQTLIRSSALAAAVSLLGCTQDPDAADCVGLDINQDGVCDRLAADFGRGAEVPATGRANIFDLPEDQLQTVAERGYRYTLDYPVSQTGVLLPYQPMVRLFDPTNGDGSVLRELAGTVLGYGSMQDIYEDVGLLPWDTDPGSAPWSQPLTGTALDDAPLGVTIVESQWGQGMTFSCNACHTGRMLGRSVRGLTNRTGRANAFFELGKDLFPLVPNELFATATGANEQEMEMFERTKENLARIGLSKPQTLGLDTSLAQVGLSLARRNDDPSASFNSLYEANPRPSALDTHIADSKPMVWWTLKYKNRWLADGSIVSGNPVFTNFLWNEIGRGTDLNELETWMIEEREKIDELTVAVFSTQAPVWSDFFDPSTIDVDAAIRGQQLYEETCAGCHGRYTKGWEEGTDSPIEAQIQTIALDYDPDQGPVDVGTSDGRTRGMDAFYQGLNGLDISQWMQTTVEPQDGYVPPPLDGIFVRYPYLHNGSVPTLCDLLLPSALRTTTFVQGPSEALADYDASCVGYPTGERIPAGWPTDQEARYDTALAGRSNAGHDAWVTDSQGNPALSQEERDDLIMFLKTL